MKATTTALGLSHPPRTRAAALAAAPREGWLRVGVLSGFVATFAMTAVFAAAYGLAQAVGSADGVVAERWFWALTHNPLMAMAEDAIVLAIGLNLVTGLLLALAYGRFFEPRLTGPGWRKGVLFAVIPWAFSIVAVLPVMGGGFLGLDLGAGPLPIAGNLIVHLAYGAVLGAFYAIPLERGLAGGETDRASAERGAAVGVAVGLVAGGVLAWMVGSGAEMSGVSGREAITVAGALLGAAVGNVLGSLLGMGRRPAGGAG